MCVADPEARHFTGNRVISVHLLYSQSVFPRCVVLLLFSTPFWFFPVTILEELYNNNCVRLCEIIFLCAHSEPFAHNVSESLMLLHWRHKWRVLFKYHLVACNYYSSAVRSSWCFPQIVESPKRWCWTLLQSGRVAEIRSVSGIDKHVTNKIYPVYVRCCTRCLLSGEASVSSSLGAERGGK